MQKQESSRHLPDGSTINAEPKQLGQGTFKSERFLSLQHKETEDLSACFTIDRLPDSLPPVASVQLAAKHADAVAALLPILMCGEESAILTFDALSNAHSSAALALATIAREEQVHELLLRRLKRALPDTATTSVRRDVRHFFIHLADRETGLHCARIVALDSALCMLFGALRAKGNPLANETTITPILAHIHADEARHVRVASQIAAALTNTTRAQTAAMEAREQLLLILQLRFDSLDCLGVDPSKLSRRLRNLPRALFT